MSERSILVSSQRAFTHSNPEIIGAGARLVREIEDKFLSRRYPWEVVSVDIYGEQSPGSDSMANLTELARLVEEEGYTPFLIGPHFSQVDPLIGILASGQNEVLRRRKYSVPIARQHLSGSGHFMSSIAGIELWPLVTESTVTDAKEKAEAAVARGEKPKPVPKEGEGQIAFMRRVFKAIEHTGVVYVAPQGTRRPLLNIPEKNPVGKLLTPPVKKGHTKIAIMAVGYEFEGVEDYSTVEGYNKGRKYLVRFDTPFKLEDIMTELGFDPNAENIAKEIQRVMNLIDEWIIRRIARVSPAAYVPPGLAPIR